MKQPPRPRRKPKFDLSKTPTINMSENREIYLLEDKPAIFEIKYKPREGKQNLDNNLDRIRSAEWLGKKVVRENDKHILKNAQKHDVDPDIVRSVMFAEHARGHGFGTNYASDYIGASKTHFPMNINTEKWASLISKKPVDLKKNASDNIEASTVLLKRIAKRIKNPTPAKVGSIWNSVGRENTNKFGEYIEQIYHRKPWREID